MQPSGSRRAVIFSLTALAVLIQAMASATPCSAQTTLFIVRHAEKGGLPHNNPRLTEAGRERANALAQMLRSTALTAVLSSEFERTRETAEPTAKMKNLEITRYRARNVGGLAKQILTEFKDKTLLITGHSDTIPALLRELGVDNDEVPRIAHEEYDNLFVVFIGQAGDVTMHRLRYGAPSAGRQSSHTHPKNPADEPGK